MTLPDEEFDWEFEEPIAVVAKKGAVDLTEFAASGRVPWEQRAERIKDRFTTVDQLDWGDALEADEELYARLLRDILKAEMAVPGRPGPRPSLNVRDATRRMQQLLGKDFALLPFPQAFKVLAGDRSIRHLANKTQLERNHVHRLLTGRKEPDGYDMRMCAQAFGKHPSYFVEWRILFIIGAVTRRMEWSPETTVGMFRKMDYQRKLFIEEQGA